MNKSILTAVTIIGLAIVNPIWAEMPDLDSNQKENQAICEQYAQEDQITPDQMAEYMNQCLQDVVNTVEEDFDPSAPEEESPETDVEESRS